MTTTSETALPTAGGLERDVLAHLRDMAGAEMSEEASAALAQAMALVAVSMRLETLTEEVREVRKVLLLRSATR